MRESSRHRRREILEAAARLFSERGFDGTTTREIAQSARINEAIIFRNFASKEVLYWAAVSEQIREPVGSDGSQLHLHASQSAKRKLSTFARRLLDLGEKDIALTRLLLFSALRNPEMSQDLWRTYASHWLETISEFIRQGARQGQLRDIDPEVGARAFLGMIVYHRVLGEIFPAKGHQKHDSRYLSQQLADIWLNGVSAGGRKSAVTSGTRNRATAHPVNGARENLLEAKGRAKPEVSRYRRTDPGAGRTQDHAVTVSET